MGFEGTASGTYQPVWDAFQDMLQPLVSMVRSVIYSAYGCQTLPPPGNWTASAVHYAA